MNKPNEIVNPESARLRALRSVNDNVEKGPADSRPCAGCYAMGGVVPKGRAANSYFGTMCHYNTYHVCKKMKKRFSPYWWNHVQISKGYVKPRKRKLRKDEIHE